jgi:hypothetical protein
MGGFTPLIDNLFVITMSKNTPSNWTEHSGFDCAQSTMLPVCEFSKAGTNLTGNFKPFSGW